MYPHNFQIVSDSQSCFLGISSNPFNTYLLPHILFIKSLVCQLQVKKTVKFPWIPSRVGIAGKESKGYNKCK